MANLVKWDPVRDLSFFSRNPDSFFREFMEFPEFFDEEDYPSPPVESFRHNGSFVVRVQLPGVNPAPDFSERQVGLPYMIGF